MKPVAEVKQAETVAAIKPVEIVKPQVKVSVEKTTEKDVAIETVLHAWAAAWSAEAVDMYLSFYHEQYRPANGMSRKSWEQQRNIRLKKPEWIKVTLSDFKIISNDGKQAEVKFKQHYQSNSYEDLTSKRMVLLYTDNGWQIFQEKSL